jgi:hypothetical protein
VLDKVKFVELEILVKDDLSTLPTRGEGAL